MRLVPIALIALCPSTLFAAVDTSMSASRWDLEKGEFLQHKGVPALQLPLAAKGVLKDLVFRDGTIEFDIELGSAGGPGIGFRRKSAAEYEYFYFRPAAKGPEAKDACQYAPVIKNVLLWDLLPQYQGPAPFRMNGWNHVRIVASGARAQIFVNDSAKPVLNIGRLEGDTTEGGLHLQGPGIFANLRVQPGVTNGLKATATAEPPYQSIVKEWSVSPLKTLTAEQEITAQDIPAATPDWKPLRMERAGLLNLTRVYGLPEGRSVAWLRTVVNSPKDGEMPVAIGWSEEVWVFVNGKQTFADKNRYLIPVERKEPDGRCATTNGKFLLPVRKGKNEVMVAVANGFFGWGLIFQAAEPK